ncbi:MAG: hypothetical protein C0609_03445 [Deltaproteobacteria bacterium]|nr:MAG: hypothetical protein C0609_03445 [Deltaproteobacteria bacterium]
MSDEKTTQERLLAAGTALFSKKHYSETSTREIAEAADANVAAINYHFGSKENLYKEVIRKVIRDRKESRKSLIDPLCSDESLPLKKLIEAFIEGHFELSDSDDICAVDLPLVFREMSSPGPGFEIIVEEMIRPNHDLLFKHIRREYPSISPERASMCIASLIAQIIHFIRARKVLESLFGREYDTDFTSRISQHIVEFSLAGMEAVACEE